MSENSAPPSAVIDTNLFVSGMIIKTGNPFAVLEAWRARSFGLILSAAQYNEITDVFQRQHIARRFAAAASELIDLFDQLAATPRVTPAPTIPVEVRDPKDIKILAAALGGHADYLVTGDRDLLEHRGDPRLGTLHIVTAAEFLAHLDPGGDGLTASRGSR